DKGFADEIMFANDQQLQPVNAISHIPSKSAVNKLMNLIYKADKDKAKPAKKENTTNSQFVELRKSKLAILFGEN
ncbi:Clp protease ClpP, partial [Lactiplantibacillus pentosus]|nr:Clp protease ClpP [Lactiplantibacillus pentosus]